MFKSVRIAAKVNNGPNRPLIKFSEFVIIVTLIKQKYHSFNLILTIMLGTCGIYVFTSTFTGKIIFHELNTFPQYATQKFWKPMFILWIYIMQATYSPVMETTKLSWSVETHFVFFLWVIDLKKKLQNTEHCMNIH